MGPSVHAKYIVMASLVLVMWVLIILHPAFKPPPAASRDNGLWPEREQVYERLPIANGYRQSYWQTLRWQNILFHYLSCNYRQYWERVIDISLITKTKKNGIYAIYAICDILSRHPYSLLDLYFPKVRLSRKKAKDKNWITIGIKNAIKHRNQLYKIKIKEDTEENVNN